MSPDEPENPPVLDYQAEPIPPPMDDFWARPGETTLDYRLFRADGVEPAEPAILAALVVTGLTVLCGFIPAGNMLLAWSEYMTPVPTLTELVPTLAIFGIALYLALWLRRFPRRRLLSLGFLISALLAGSFIIAVFVLPGLFVG